MDDLEAELERLRGRLTQAEGELLESKEERDRLKLKVEVLSTPADVDDESSHLSGHLAVLVTS